MVLSGAGPIDDRIIDRAILPAIATARKKRWASGYLGPAARSFAVFESVTRV